MENSTNSSSSIKSFKKCILNRVLFFSIILPVAGILVFDGIELIVTYFSNYYDFAIGIILAQIISIVGDVFTFCCLCLTYCSLGANQMSFGTSSSKMAFGLVVLSPVVSTIVSVLTLYIVVILGWHNFTLRMLFAYLPIFLSNAGLSAIINTLVSVVIFAAFYLSGPMRSSFEIDQRYIFTVKLVVGLLIIIKTVSLGLDIVFYDGGYSGVNSIVKGIVFPILCEGLEIGVAIFAIKRYIEHLSRKATEHAISF